MSKGQSSGSPLLLLTDFRDRFQLNLESANRQLSDRLVRGNLTYAVRELTLSLPVRKMKVEGELRPFVVLGRDAEPEDEVVSLTFRPQRQAP